MFLLSLQSSIVAGCGNGKSESAVNKKNFKCQGGKMETCRNASVHETRVRDGEKLLAGELIHHRRTFQQRVMRVTMVMPVLVIA
jgi:hypothetical protein